MCEFCQNHEQGDTLYEPSDWDGGIGFDYIRDIKYCPLCGKKLNSEDEPTISKMEQVDKDINVRSKTEPQLTEKCPFDDSLPCKWVCTEYGKCKYKYKPKTEPQTDNGIGCSKCESRFWCMDRDMPHAVHCNNYGKTEPSTDCSWK